jgi:glutamine---fructose-6-phosphate transaminase (isomerizing)
VNAVPGGSSSRSHLETEIAAQPDAVQRLLDTVVPRLDTLAATTRDVDHVVLVGRGSSDNAARYAQYLLGIQHGLPVGLATPSVQTLYGATPRFGRAMVVAVSQSGRSPDVVEVLRAARDQGRPAIAVTNDPSSPLAAVATMVVPLTAGEERAVAATGTYTTSLVALALLSVAFRPAADRGPWLAELAALPDQMATVLADTRRAVPHEVVALRHLLVTGRGLAYGTAFEVALKVRELTGMLAEAFSPPDLLHGPIAAVDDHVGALLIAPAEPSAISQRELLGPLRERGASVAAISSDPELLEAVDLALPLASEPPAWLTPVTAVLPGQVLAGAIARARGRDVDAPVGLRKITETR